MSLQVYLKAWQPAADSAKNAQNCQRYVNSDNLGLTKQGYNSTTAGILSNYTLLPQKATELFHRDEKAPRPALVNDGVV